MDDLLTLIRGRHSSRQLFDSSRAITKDDLDKILEAGRWAPTAHNMQNFEVVIVDDKKLIGSIAGVKTPVSLTFVRENYDQLSFSEEELEKKKTGVLAKTFPAAWRNPNIKKRAVNDNERSEFLKNDLNSSPVLGIVLYETSRRAPASKGDFLGIISLGCVMENMWLMANSLGIDFQVISSLSVGSAKKVIKKLLNIPKKHKIAFSFRLGYAVKSENYLRVRREIATFVHHNKYVK